jgi:hypothetical protein
MRLSIILLTLTPIATMLMMMASPAMAGTWGCLAKAQNAQSITLAYPNQSQAARGAMKRCHQESHGAACHIVTCNDHTSTAEQAMKEWPAPKGFQKHGFQHTKP